MGKDLLAARQKRVISLLSQESSFLEHFYFTGGTPLAAYYLNHRYSEDLDFFSEEEIDLIWLNALRERLKRELKADEATIRQSFNRNLLFFNFGSELLKTEFTYFPFKQIENPQLIDGIRVDSLKDIAVNKFFTIYQKPAARHFIDLYLILKKGATAWGELPELARIKFDTPIDPIQLGAQLVSAESISDMPRMVINLDEEEWRNFFLEKAKGLKRQISRT